MSILWTKSQKARKEHWCDWCGDRIRLGEWYSRNVWAVGKRLEVIRQHDICPEDALGLPDPVEVPVAVAFSIAVRLTAVQRVRIDGSVETAFEPKLVAVAAPEPELSPGEMLDDDIPF